MKKTYSDSTSKVILTYRAAGAPANAFGQLHVDDLVMIAEAALLSDVTGAFPVGDDEPCPSLEISDFAARMIGADPPLPSGELPAADTRSANRRVDGRAIRRLLGVELRYPSYRVGLPAALAEESRRASIAESESAPA